MMKHTFLALVTLVAVMAFACNQDDPLPIVPPVNVAPDSNCDQIAVIDDNLYDTAPTETHFIDTVYFQGDCLVITYAGSGCSGNSFEEALIGNTLVLESFPVQRQMRLSFKSNEDCLAVFTKTVTFNLLPAQVTNEPSVLISLEGYDQQILYEY